MEVGAEEGNSGPSKLVNETLVIMNLHLAVGNQSDTPQVFLNDRLWHRHADVTAEGHHRLDVADHNRHLLEHS